MEKRPAACITAQSFIWESLKGHLWARHGPCDPFCSALLVPREVPRPETGERKDWPFSEFVLYQEGI